MKKIEKRDIEITTQKRYSSVYLLCTYDVDKTVTDFMNLIDEKIKDVDPNENISFYHYDCGLNFEFLEQYNIVDLPCVLYFGNGQYCTTLKLEDFDLTNGLKEFNKNCNIKYQLKKEVV